MSMVIQVHVRKNQPCATNSTKLKWCYQVAGDYLKYMLSHVKFGYITENAQRFCAAMQAVAYTVARL